MLHYLTSKETVIVNRRSGIDADDINAEPSSSGNGKFVVVLDVVTEGGCVVASVISVELVASRLLFGGKKSQPNIGLLLCCTSPTRLQ